MTFNCRDGCDVAVIGGGTGGDAAANAAASHGKRVVMINDGPTVGLCVGDGCMPSKAVIACGKSIHHARRKELAKFGIESSGLLVANFEAVMKRKSDLVERFIRARLRMVKNRPYTVVYGRARFNENGKLEVNNRPLEAKRYIIATGSRPSLPAIDGLDSVGVLTSDLALKLNKLPASMVVYGGGPIALELSQFFARMGTMVLLVSRSHLLHRIDKESGQEMERMLASEPNLDLLTPWTIDRVVRKNSQIKFSMKKRGGTETQTYQAEQFLVATGREPMIQGLGIEHLGIELSHGIIRHDRCMQTSNPRVFVAGDVTGRNKLLHVARLEGEAAGLNAISSQPQRAVPLAGYIAIIFTDYPLAHVGMTELKARAVYQNVWTGRVLFSETGRAICEGVEHGLWKIIADADNGRILGCVILGPRADDLIHRVSDWRQRNVKVPEILDLEYGHPTYSEVAKTVAQQWTKK